MHQARISAEHRGGYHILTPEGEIPAHVSGVLRHAAQSRSNFPAVGDRIAYTQSDGGPAVIEAILPRRSAIIRKSAGAAATEQIIAANVDWLLVVSGLDGDFNVRRIERYLALAHAAGVNAAILLNKADLCRDLETKLEELQGITGHTQLHVLSALHADGLDTLDPYLEPGMTIALAGSSGVGKSTIANALLGNARQATQSVREGDERGRHTTTSRQLFELPSGAFLIDTPGMRELHLWASEGAVEESFDDIRRLAASCRFNDCAHGGEPGCAVREAMGKTLDPARFENYQKLLREQAFIERQTDAQAARAEKARWKKVHREAQEHMRIKRLR